ncbi:MAG: LOG family protein [Phycisphaerales bacterium]|nr:LOG family protein [Phycisphaerales bacterium]
MTAPDTPRPEALPVSLRRRTEAFVSELLPEVDVQQRRHVEDLVRSAVRLALDGADEGQMRLVSRAVREMRHAWVVFNAWRGTRKIAIYGSARTPEDHPDYEAARAFSRLMAGHDWMSITGAGDGIMKAGHEGPSRSHAFGLRIRLPFETAANTVIEGDPKLVSFRYFFTRKLMFMAHADAVAVCPGGFGTQDELFECLTLIQTGKSSIVPVVLLEGAGGHYWDDWLKWIREHLNDNGWISCEDLSLLHIARTPEEALEHVLKFYRRFHSARYVGPRYVIRLSSPLGDADLEALRETYGDLVDEGTMHTSGPLPGETDHLDLQRLVFVHTKRDWGRMRQLIDAINAVP